MKNNFYTSNRLNNSLFAILLFTLSSSFFACNSDANKASAPLVFDGEGSYRGTETFAEFREDNTYYIYKNNIGQKPNYHTGTFRVSNDTIHLTGKEAYRMSIREKFLITERGIKELYKRRPLFFKGDTKKLLNFTNQLNNN